MNLCPLCRLFFATVFLEFVWVAPADINITVRYDQASGLQLTGRYIPYRRVFNV